MSKVINCGSLNIDHVYHVPHIVRPGETIACDKLDRHAGGKGANQSLALGRAGVETLHVGQVGRDGLFLKEGLAAAGVDVDFVDVVDEPTGHAIIQVAADGENAITLFPGANRSIPEALLSAAFARAAAGDVLLLQNETNVNLLAMRKASALGMTICLNPAPFDAAIERLPLESLGILVVNETEGEGLAGCTGLDDVIPALARRCPKADIIITLGGEGAVGFSRGTTVFLPARKVAVVDTTAAGDTFIGYYLAGRVRGMAMDECMRLGRLAASICVGRPGAADSIPRWDEL